MTEQIEPQRRRRRQLLTDKQVRGLQKKKLRYSYSDPEMRGHYVRVMPDGPNVFCVVTRDPYGKQIWHTIGNADELKIEESREAARLAIGRIKKGLPVVERVPEKPDSFRVVAQNWLKRHVAAKKLRTAADIERCLTKYVFPHWADREFVGVKRGDVAKLLDHVEDHHGSRQADVCLTILRSIANWYAVRNDDYVPPFARGMSRHTNKPRDRVLSDPELREVWKQAEAEGTFGALVRLLLLTGQRRGAILRGLRWDNISADGVWQIPTEEREKGNAGSLKLPKQALEIINAQSRFAGNPHVLAASHGDGPLAGFVRAKRRFDKRCGVSDWVLHDLRRTSRTLMSRAGVDRDISERVLGHTVGTAIEAVYDHHHFFEEKADALARLANLIERIVHPPEGNAVSLYEAAVS
jgi:integrase